MTTIRPDDSNYTNPETRVKHPIEIRSEQRAKAAAAILSVLIIAGIVTAAVTAVNAVLDSEAGAGHTSSATPLENLRDS